MAKKISSSLTELRNQALTSRAENTEEYQLPDQPKVNKPEKKGRSSTRGISFYQNDEESIRKLQEFFFSKGKNLPDRSKILRVALRLTTNLIKENEYLLLSIYQEVENNQ